MSEKTKFLYFIFLILFCFIIPSESMAIPDITTEVPVTKVVDGDTIEVMYNNEKRQIRLIGIDTPETVVNDKTLHDAKKWGLGVQKVLEMGEEATRHVASIVKRGDRIKLEFDDKGPRTDPHNRLLGYVYLKSAFFLNAELLKKGYARTFFRDWKDGREFEQKRYNAEFQRIEDEARRNRVGFWKVWENSPQPGISTDKPPIPYEDFGACPFEGCVYREWIATEDTVAFKDRKDASSIVYIVRKGDKVVAITGVVITVKPGRAKVLTQFDYGDIRAKPGDILYLLTYQGEGRYKIWFQGKLIDEGQFGELPRERMEEGQYIWWVNIKSKKGQIGWINKPENFSNKDLFE